jgi:hypothetical protein
LCVQVPSLAAAAKLGHVTAQHMIELASDINTVFKELMAETEKASEPL